MAQFDQRWVRRMGVTFISASSTACLCLGCGRRDVCKTVDTVRFGQGCMLFMPVISFVDETGLNAGFNTFRRGAGIFNRLVDGVVVALYSKAQDKLIGNAVVVGRHSGKLGGLLVAYAHGNHLMLQVEREAAPARLAAVLARLYGKNYSAADCIYSVIIMERTSGGS